MAAKQQNEPDETTLELQQQVGELTEALQRERADAINMRRQHQDQMTNLKGYVTAEIVESLLPVIDNFERALKHVPADLAEHQYVKGVSGVVKQFEKTLQDLGVEKIKTVGELFDHNTMEAVSVEGEGEQEVVSEEVQAGYTLNGSVLRVATVKVGKA
jgi:molecular chaperone GrpE